MKLFAGPFLVAHLCLVLAMMMMDVSGGMDSDAAVVSEIATEEDDDTTANTIFLRKKNDFHNWASNVGVGGPYEKMFTPKNSVTGAMQSSDFLTGLQQIKDAVAEAASAGKRLRAFGSTLSLNDMTYTKEYLLDSRELNYYKIGIDADEHVAPAYLTKKQQLVFVQSGIMVRPLNLKLLDAGLALPSSCNPDGVRFVGAVSTSAHGSQRSVGGMSNYVKAIHLVIPGDNVIVQEATDPVVTAAYAQSMGNARLISNDNLFRAALVSFGSFGVIHGMIFEAAPLFLIKYRTRVYDYDELKPAMATLNISTLKGLDDMGDTPFSMEFVLNPYRRKRGAGIRVQQKLLISNTAKPEEAMLLLASDAHDIPKNDPELQKEMKRFSQLSARFLFKPVKRLLSGVICQIMLRATQLIQLNGKTWFPHQINTVDGTQKRRAPVYLRKFYESEISVPHNKTIETIELILNILHDDPYPIVLGMRNMKKNKATIGTHIYDMTSGISVLGVHYDNALFSDRTEVIFQRVFTALEAKRNEIPHTYHWGKRFPFNDRWVLDAYGDAILNWKAERATFLGADGLRMFTNEFMEILNITS